MVYFIFDAIFTISLTLLVTISNHLYTTWYHYIFIILLLCGFFIVSFILDYVLFFILTFLKPVNKNEEFHQGPDSKYEKFFFNQSVGILLGTIRIKAKATGLKKIPDEDGFLVISNHRSMFDPLILSNVLLKKHALAWIVKDFIKKVPGVYQMAYGIGYLPIKREDLRQSMRVINESVKKIKENKQNIGVFPEGTRNKTENTILPFHHGTLKIALKAQCPIVVITMLNSENINKNSPWRSTPVYINVTKVLQYDEYKDLSSTELASLLENEITQDYTRLKAELK